MTRDEALEMMAEQLGYRQMGTEFYEFALGDAFNAALAVVAEVVPASLSRNPHISTKEERRYMHAARDAIDRLAA